MHLMRIYTYTNTNTCTYAYTCSCTYTHTQDPATGILGRSVTFDVLTSDGNINIGMSSVYGVIGMYMTCA